MITDRSLEVVLRKQHTLQSGEMERVLDV